jgi:ABC-type transport system substrate-binding protein
LVITKNPDYYKAGLPKIDEIKFEVGVDPTVALARLKAGEIDLLGDSIPAASYVAESADEANKGLIIEGGQLQTGYVTLNVKTKPFDNVKVRQALNHAINKDRIVQIINGRAVPANQPLPPSMPGYDKDYKGFGYDVAKAKALLAEAGLASGFTSELWTSNTDPNPRIAQAIQQDLAEIGVKVTIKSLAQANVIEAGGNGTAPMIWSGGMAWIADFPDASNFWGPILGCGGTGAGGWNWSKYCNKSLDAEATKADSMTNPKDADARVALWKSIFTRANEEAPWIPIFNEKRITMKSDRLGGADELFVDPVHIPVNYDHVFIK